MAATGRTPLLLAVSAYTRRARQRLEAGEVEVAVRLLKELNRRLPGQNLLTATVEELKEAGARLFAEGEPRSRSRFLSAELRELFDAALAEGLVLRHPLTGAVRLPDPDSPPAGAVITREEAAAEAVQVIANLLEDAIRVGLAVPGMAVAVAEVGEGGAPGPRALERLVSRWSLLTGRARWLLEVVRFAVPVAALVLGLQVAMEQGGPLNPGEGMTTGQALQELKVGVNLLASREMSAPPSKRSAGGDQWNDGPPAATGAAGLPAGDGSFDQLAQLVGMPFSASSRVFTLERFVAVPPTLYLRHRESGALLVVAEGRRAVLDRGRWRVTE
jgi:hypothetical protein